jgi:hypothetical protein
LGHWVGDIHHPLHVSFKDDLGGNKISVTGQCKGNLHAAWDSCLVQYAVGPIATEAATDLLAAITPEMQSQWSASKPLDWANESFSITEAAPTQYCVIHDSSCDSVANNIIIGEAYLNANESVVKQQLQRAGVRLGKLLGEALRTSRDYSPCLVLFWLRRDKCNATAQILRLRDRTYAVIASATARSATSSQSPS